MQLIKNIFIALACLATSFTVVAAHEPNKTNDTLLKATSPFEDMVKYALNNRETNLVKALTAADTQAPAIREALPPAAASEFDKLFKILHQARTDKNNFVLASSAVQTFHLLIANLQQPETLKVPVEVEWLDYAGFKLHVLASAPTHDWPAMRQTVEDIAKWWEAIKPKVTDKSLRYTMNSAVKGLQEAGQTENRPMLYFAAQMDLDLVDLLENHFEGKK